jgi:predicted dehydrogenase
VSQTGGRHVRWGVLGTARIATAKVVPALQRSAFGRVTAIASRQIERAQRAAVAAGIPRAYGAYGQLLDDPDVDAVYIPLPNRLHVEWATRAAEAGKHVLIEKPVAMDAAGAAALVAVRDRTGLLMQEAFMIRAHPQWETAIDLIRRGRLGAVRAVHVFFGYRNLDPANIRNVPDLGGGGLLDIGCYIVHAARWIFDREPSRAVGVVDRDPVLGVDRLTSMILDFGDGQAVGTCATQATPYQRVQIIGETGRLEIRVPFNAPADRPCRLWIDDGSDLEGGGVAAIDIEPADQYTRQGDRFAKAILDGAPPPLPLEDAVANMRVLDAIRGLALVPTLTAPQPSRA